MARKIDVVALKRRSDACVAAALTRYDNANVALPSNHLLMRWIAQMTAVEIHATWERYVESRLVAALNHDPSHFLKANSIVGVKRLSSDFAQFIVRGGGRFFDFRSTSELLSKGDALLSKNNNPFRSLTSNDCEYIDALAAIRNCIVHGSDAAVSRYKRTLSKVYNVRSAPGPDEFLHALDNRAISPARRQSRVKGLAIIISRAIQILD